jgi:hypothetical protein
MLVAAGFVPAFKTINRLNIVDRQSGLSGFGN